MKRNRHRRWCAGLGVLAAVIAGLGLCRGPILVAIGRGLDVGAKPQRSDYVMLLPGGPDTRTFAAAAIARHGLSQKVLTPQNKLNSAVLDGTAIPAHQLTAVILQRLGVPALAIIILEGNSSSTFEDARALGEFLASRPAATVTVVTDAHHTRRARWVFQREVAGHMDRIRFAGAPNDEFDPDNWWRYKRGIVICTSEYLKLFYYIMRFGSGTIWLGALLLLAIALLVRRRWKPITGEAAPPLISAGVPR